MSKKCTHKVKFATFTAARAAANAYMEDIVLTFYPMIAYYCNKHRCYHVGHNKFNREG